MVGPLDARRIYRCPRSQWSRLPEVSMALVTSQALSHQRGMSQLRASEVQSTSDVLSLSLPLTPVSEVPLKGFAKYMECSAKNQKVVS